MPQEEEEETLCQAEETSLLTPLLLSSSKRSATMNINMLYLCVIVQLLFGSLRGFNDVSIL